MQAHELNSLVSALTVISKILKQSPEELYELENMYMQITEDYPENKLALGFER